MNQTPIEHKHTFSLNGVLVRTFHANKGEGLPKHEHVFVHVTQVHAGKLAVRKENLYLELTKDSQPISLKENEWHELEALEDGTVFCNIYEDGKTV